MAISVMTAKREKSGEAVEGTVPSHGPAVGPSLDGTFIPLLQEGETWPGFLLLLQLLVRYLGQKRENMIAKDKAHHEELDDDAPYRTERDKAVDELNDLLLALRETIVSLYGEETAKKLGFIPRRERDPQYLLRLAQNILARFEAPLELPPPRLASVAFDPTAVVGDLKPVIDRLRTALDHLVRELREADVTQVAKNAAIAEYDEAFLWVSKTLEALYTLAGERDLAARVRPSTRRPGRREVDEPDEETETSTETETSSESTTPSTDG